MYGLTFLISKRICFVTDVVGVIQNYIQAYVDWTCPHQLDHCMITNDKAHHDDVIRWKHFPRYWPCLRGIHRPMVNSPHKCQWRGALMFSLICSWANVWANNREVGDLRHRCAHYDIPVMNNKIPQPDPIDLGPLTLKDEKTSMLWYGEYLLIYALSLTHWGRDKVDVSSRTTFFKCIFLNEKAWISVKLSPKFVPRGAVDNIRALVQIMAWRRIGDKPLSEPMMVIVLRYICVIRPQWVVTEI